MAKAETYNVRNVLQLIDDIETSGLEICDEISEDEQQPFQDEGEIEN